MKVHLVIHFVFPIVSSRDLGSNYIQNLTRDEFSGLKKLEYL